MNNFDSINHWAWISLPCFDISSYRLNVGNETRGGFRGGADAYTPPPPPSGIRPPANPKGPPFDTFLEIHFWPTDP